MSDEFEDARAAAAFRAATAGGLVDELGVDPRSVRVELQQHRSRMTALAVAVVAVLMVAAVPLLGSISAGPATDPSQRTAPAGWRLEQYRDVSLLVPDTWGYGIAPGRDWCHRMLPRGYLDPHPSPYVSLGGAPRPSFTSGGGALPACGQLPDYLISEHLEIDESSRLGPDAVVPGTEQHDGWWIVARIMGQGDAAISLKVVSRDHDLAQRIVDSAITGGPCPATSPVQWGGNRAAAADLAAVQRADQLRICQYDEGTDGGLRAARLVTESQARGLAAALRDTLEKGKPAASECVGPRGLDLALTVQAGASAPIYVTSGTCFGVDEASTRYGGVDGGGSIRELSTEFCQQIIQPPVTVDLVRSGAAPCDR